MAVCVYVAMSQDNKECSGSAISKDLFTVRDQNINQTCAAICVVNMMEYIIRKLSSSKTYPYFDEKFIHFNVHTKLYKNVSFWNKPLKVKDAITISIKMGCAEVDYKKKPISSASVLEYGVVTQVDSHKILDIVTNLIQNGIPVVIGVKYTGFNSKELFFVKSKVKKDTKLGDHAVTLIGLDSKNFVFLNSWGPDWGNNGRGLMPYECVANILEIHGKPPYFLTTVKYNNKIYSLSDYLPDIKGYTIIKSR